MATIERHVTNVLVALDALTPCREAAKVMRDKKIGSVAVREAGRVVGIITERDLVRAIADGLNPKQARAGVIMTAEPATVREDEDVSVVALRMMRLGVRHLPVVDAAGRPTGLLSAGDLVAVLDRATS